MLFLYYTKCIMYLEISGESDLLDHNVALTSENSIAVSENNVRMNITIAAAPTATNWRDVF